MPVEIARENKSVKKVENSFVFNKVDVLVGDKKIAEFSEGDFVKTNKRATKKVEK